MGPDAGRDTQDKEGKGGKVQNRHLQSAGHLSSISTLSRVFYNSHFTDEKMASDRERDSLLVAWRVSGRALEFQLGFTSGPPEPHVNFVFLNETLWCQ